MLRRAGKTWLVLLLAVCAGCGNVGIRLLNSDNRACGPNYGSKRDCGTGYCRDSNAPSTCVDGLEQACVPGQPLSSVDSSCDAVDDDCDGHVDEDFSGSVVRCGVGACAEQGSVSCEDGSEVEHCQAKAAAQTDASCDGVDDDCDGKTDENYQTNGTRCGMGACARTGVSSCVNGGTQDTCVPGAAVTSDTTCDGNDDDCNGANDEDFVASMTSCGVGLCMRTGMSSCVNGSLSSNCIEGSPTVANDGPPANGRDEDCDGLVDEDSCDTTPRTFMPGAHTLTAPAGCNHLTVRLWGGGGASGDKSVPWSSGNSGRGGAGGYASSLVNISGALALYVGNGGASGCGPGGINAGSNSYAGGAGGAGLGKPGGDAVVAGGGGGGHSTTGSDGGRGHYGGGGGGQGDPSHDPPGGDGGGGGAATVLVMGGAVTVVAGGGGGSGGEPGNWWGDSKGGSGGDGCSIAGQAGELNASGAGGGGGLCIGTTVQRGLNGEPFNSGDLPNNQAAGATDGVPLRDGCGAGGGGYAIVTFSH
ncbi:MAG: hypothetical protein RL701_3804 [Pseudomonadota bacterium]|jgi:hypothetical protein